MRKTLTLCLFLISIITLNAAPVKNLAVLRVQPKGDTLHCFVTGDEFFHRLHDANDYTIVLNPETGWYVYAQVENGLLVPTQWIPGQDDPATVGLTPGLMPGKEVLKKRHDAWEIPEKYRPETPKTSGANHGTLNNIVIFIRFSDEQTCTSVSPTEMNNKFNDSSANAVSLYSYLKVASFNKLNVVTHFYPALSSNTVLSYQDSLPRGYFQPYSTSNPQGYDPDDDYERANREFDLLERAVNWVNANCPIPSSLNIDMDNDGLIDNVCFVVSGSNDGWSDLLWPHKWSLYDRIVNINNKRVYVFNFQLAGSGDHYFGVSTLCHEMTHTLGCPDLYHYNEYTTVSPAGSWDLMEQNSTPPQMTNSLFKYKYLNWFDSIPELTDSGRYTIQSLATGPNRAYKIASRNSNQWYILEYRNTDDRFDSSIPNRGLLIWRYNNLYEADNASFDDDTPHELWLFRPGSNNDFTNGTISAASFGVSGRTSFGPNTNPHPYLCNGRADNSFELTDIAVSADYSSVSFTFHPLETEGCNDITMYPYGQDFEDGDLSCWTFISANTENGLNMGNGAGITTNHRHTGSCSFQFSSYNRANSSNNDYHQYLISPKLTNHDSLLVSFYYRRYSLNYPESVSVKYSTTTNDSAAFIYTLWSNNNIPDTFQRQQVLLPPEAKYLAFCYNADYKYFVYLDDIEISEVCGPIHSYPYLQPFESGDLGCWEFVSVNTENDIDGSSNHAGVATDNAHGGNYCFRFSSYSRASNSDYNQYLIAPELVHSSPIQLQFYYKKGNYSMTESLRVKYSTTTNNPTDFTQTLWTNNSVQSSYQSATVTLPTEAKYVALNYFSNYAYYIYVDDLQLLCNETHDTTYITIHDTVHTILYDTLTTWIHDTLTTQVTDTLYHIINDTIINWVHDTINRNSQKSIDFTLEPILIHDTIYVYDTTWIVTHDTINRILHDTTWIVLRDTLWLTRHDTTYLTLHDTTYIDNSVSITTPKEPNFIVHTKNGRIEVMNTDGLDVRVYDINGRCLFYRRKVAQECSIEGLISGVYLVQIGNYPAKKVVLLK